MSDEQLTPEEIAEGVLRGNLGRSWRQNVETAAIAIRQAEERGYQRAKEELPPDAPTVEEMTRCFHRLNNDFMKWLCIAFNEEPGEFVAKCVRTHCKGYGSTPDEALRALYRVVREREGENDANS